MFPHARKYGIIALMALLIFLLTQCMGPEEKANAEGQENGLAGAAFVGDDKCMPCHAEQVKQHFETAHHFSSAWGNEQSILGSLQAGENSFWFSPRLEMRMEKIGDSVYQTAYLQGQNRERRAMDLVFGSGTKGQSYASWQGDRLFQLPITWFSAKAQWSNSPGFPGKAVFNRPITGRCLECHISYAKQISPPGVEPESFDRASLILTISCEKCHGPGDKHVGWHEKNLKDSAGQYILNPANFTRQQQLDLCGLCHGGKLNSVSPAFSFQPGDRLEAHFNMDSLQRNPLAIDVHGNQLGLLAASKCFTASEMTCSSCHDGHKKERGQLEVYSQRCMSCHGQQRQVSCKLSSSMGAVIQKNCIDCHMPKEPSRSVAVQLQGMDVPTPAIMRSHHIRILKDKKSHEENN